MGRNQTKQVPLETLNELYYYQDGRLHHKIASPNGVAQPGKVVGCLHGTGYLITSIKKKQFQIHRLIYQICNQIELTPEISIDHVDGNRLNNLIENLRPCTGKENSRNRKKPSNNTSGHKNIFKHSLLEGGVYKTFWKVSVRNGDVHRQARFPYTEDGLREAVMCRDTLVNELHKEFASLG